MQFYHTISADVSDFLKGLVDVINDKQTLNFADIVSYATFYSHLKESLEIQKIDVHQKLV